MKKFISAFLASAFLLSSCGGGASEQKQEVNDKLVVGVMPSVDHLPLLMGIEQHYFDSLGLDLELTPFTSPMERDAALQAGEIDGTISDYTTIMIQQSKGLPVQMLFATNGMFEMLVGAESGIKTIQDLKSKRIGLSSNTVIEYATDEMLSRAGLQPSDVEKVEVQKIPLRLEMLAKGEIDAAVLPQPFVGLGLTRGLTILSASNEAQTFPITGLAIDTVRTKDKATALDKLVQGYNLAVDYLNSTDKAQWAPIAARLLKVDEQVILSAGFSSFNKAQSPLAVDNPHRYIVGNVAKWLGAKGLVPSENYTGEEAISSVLPTGHSDGEHRH